MVEVKGLYRSRKCNDASNNSLRCDQEKLSPMVGGEMVEVTKITKTIYWYQTSQVQEIQVVGATVVPTALRCARREIAYARGANKKLATLACEISLPRHRKALGTFTAR